MLRDHRSRPVPFYRLDRYGRGTPDFPEETFARIRAALIRTSRSGMALSARPLLLLVVIQLGMFAWVVTRTAPPYVIWAQVLIAAVFVIGAVTYRYRLPRVPRETIAAAMLAERLCASCAYDLTATEAAADGRRTCPECGAAWAIPSDPE